MNAPRSAGKLLSLPGAVLTDAERRDLIADMIAEAGIFDRVDVTAVSIPAPLGRARVRMGLTGSPADVAGASAFITAILRHRDARRAA